MSINVLYTIECDKCGRQWNVQAVPTRCPFCEEEKLEIYLNETRQRAVQSVLGEVLRCAGEMRKGHLTVEEVLKVVVGLADFKKKSNQ